MEEEKEKKVRQNNTKSKKIIIITILIVIFICLLFSVAFAIFNITNDKVIKGVMVENIDVSGYTKDKLEEKLTNLTNEDKEKSIVLKYQETSKTITPENLEASYNVKDIANDAYLIGRKGNIFTNNFEIVQTLIFKKNIKMNEQINDSKIDENIKSLNETLPGIVQNYDYYIDGKQLVITKGKKGIKVDEEKLKSEIKDAIKDFSTNTVVVDIPVIEAYPDDIDIEKIHNEIYKEAQDAYISQDPLTVHPNVNGIDFAISIDEAKKSLQEEKDEYTIPLKITVANKTLSDLGKEAFPNELGTFYTKYDVSNTNRSTNIKLATNKINETIIMPGETFSYNQTVGKRTIEAGYKEAGAYAGGQIVQEVGGGICQVSSTLYNAVLYANLEVVERYNHCFESSYVDVGRDATVSWGTVDFKFKNNRKYPIKILATSKNGVETVSINGIKEENEYDIIIQSKKISTIDRSIRYVEDPTIDEGREIVEQTGHDGCVSETYKIIRQSGKIISNKLISRDTYNSLEKIIKKGTKKVEETENTINTSTDTIENNMEINSEIGTKNGL